MKNIIKYIFILISLFIIFIILNLYKSKKSIFDDIMIFSLWNNLETEYEIDLQDTVEIDVFTTIKNNIYKKVAPGTNGEFTIKFKRPTNSNYKIQIKEKTKKPKNLIFIVRNHKYSSIEEMEQLINEMFVNTEQVTIKWEWKYFINNIEDIQDTKDGERAQKYIFEIETIIE